MASYSGDTPSDIPQSHGRQSTTSRDFPSGHHLQTLTATSWICTVLFGEAASTFLFLKLAYSSYWWLAVVYSIWMLNDINVCNRGGRKIEWVRNWSCWRHYRDYFPIKLVKTTDLDPTRNYLFTCFPHGVLCFGAFAAFGTNALDFQKTFPGFTCHMSTRNGHFMVPFFRDLLLALGGCSSSRESLMYLLDQKRNKGNCVALIVGGAHEALESHPGEYKVILSRKKGFVRNAMLSGAPLVPVFSFGEPDVYQPLSNSEANLRKIVQEIFRRFTGISLSFPMGRGAFQHHLGFVPLQAPITTVVGTPLEVQKNLDPTDEEVDAVHAQFSKQVVDMFEKEKSKYLSNHKDVHLIVT